MSHKRAAIAAITNQYAGTDGGAQAVLGIDLDPIIDRLLNGLINVCLGDMPAESVAGAMVEPSDSQRSQLRRATLRESRKAIRRNKNPTGGRISRSQRDDMRAEMAEDLERSMTFSSDHAGYANTVNLVREYRR